MKFSINQSSLLDALTVTSKSVSTNSQNAVISGICIQSEGDNLVFQSTNLESSIKYTAPALIDEPGKTVIPSRILLDSVKSLPDAAVHFNIDDTNVMITCENTTFSTRCLPADDFPEFPMVETQESFSVPYDQFTAMVKKIIRAVSKDESRPIIQGAKFEIEGNRFTMVATDSYRLAVATYDLEDCPLQEFSAVVTSSFLNELVSLPASQQDIVFAFSDNQVVAQYKDLVFINRRVEGKYPNYKQIIPSAYQTRITLPTTALLSAVKRMALYGAKGGSLALSVSITGGVLMLSANSHETGSAQETIPIQGEGEDLEIGFSFHYLLEGLNTIPTDEVCMEFVSPIRPGVLKGVGDDNYIHILMPTHIAR